MQLRQIVGIALIVLGILGLVYGQVTYTEKTHDVSLGPIEFEVKEKERINIPVWAGVAAILVGAGVLVVRRSK